MKYTERKYTNRDIAMENQTNLDLTGKQLRDQGMERATDHAERVLPGWKQQAYDFVEAYAASHEIVTTEEVRAAAVGIVEEHEEARAWGSIMVKLAKSGVITKVGVMQRKTPVAHCAFATLWKSNIYRKRFNNCR